MINLTERLINYKDDKGNRIPDYMHVGITYYVESGILPGDFLVAILTNDLRSAVRCADDTNMDLIPTYVKFFYSNVPYEIWGSNAKVQDHVERCLNRTHTGGAAGEVRDDPIGGAMPAAEYPADCHSGAQATRFRAQETTRRRTR
jgi:hypothetical protein